MARVVRRAGSVLAKRGPSSAVQRRARKHKVVMESITREKKKLRSIISFEAKAPSGYTFIPAGNPHLTTACKERCRKEGLEIHAVSTTPHLKTHNLSQHVHRIGFHFPSTVVAAVCSELGLYLTSTGKAVPFHTLGTVDNNSQGDPNAPQEVINTEARDTIKDLFPNIPDNDLYQIIKTSFQKGQRKVGTAFELPLARRAQLSVVAHVRHCYTDYDRLLKRGSFHEARSAVEQTTLKTVISWRGDDENGQTVLEDVFREVIVISDDEDSEAEEESVTTGIRDPSVEIISSNARAHDIQTQPLHGKITTQDPVHELSEEAPPGFRVVTNVPAKKAVDRRGFSRYQAWNRALTRYRAEAQDTEHDLGDIQKGNPSPRETARPTVVQDTTMPVKHGENIPHPVESSTRNGQGTFLEASLPQRPLIGNGGPGKAPLLEAPLPQRPPVGNDHLNFPEKRGSLGSPLSFSRRSQLIKQKPSDSRLAEKSPRRGISTIPLQGKSHQPHLDPGPEGRIPVPSTSDKTNLPVFVNGSRELQQSSESQFGSRTEPPVHPHYHRPGMSPRDLAIPSIENQWQPEKRRTDSRLEHMTNRMSLRSVTPVHIQGEMFDHGPGSLPNSPDDPNGKRRRTVFYSGSHYDLRSDARSGRPVPVSGELSPRVPYRRDEFGTEFRSQEGHPIRQDYPFNPQDKPLLNMRSWEKRPESFIVPPSLETRPATDRIRFHPHNALHNPPASSGASSVTLPGDHAFKPVLDSSREVWPSYPVDRSPLDRVRSFNTEDSRAFNWDPRTDGTRQTFYEAPPGKVYADGFVRQVDVREVHPVDFPNNGLRPQPGSIIQPSRTRASDIPHTRSTSEQRQLPSPRVAQISHGQPIFRSEAPGSPGSRQHYGRGGVGARDRRHGGGLSTSRRVHDPRYFQMAEQNRPVYVQRVESQPPPNPVPDGRHVVIVD